MGAPLIGLMGKKRSGKDTFAARLIESHGFVRVAFADPLRATLEDLDPLIRIEADELGPLAPEITPLHWELPLTPRLCYLVHRVGWERAKALREVRRLMQAHGVAIRDHVGESVWVDAAMAKVDDLRHSRISLRTFKRSAETPVVITDVRFPNEADAIRAAGGLLVRIERPGLPVDDSANGLHVSETALDDYPADFTYVNAGTVADLHRLADTVLL